MSWQEELRRIDGDLAAGRLSKEQYAVRREELLAEASSAPVTTTQREPVEPEGRPDVSAVISPPVPAKDLLTTDRQTTAPSPADERSTDSMPHPLRRQADREPEPVKPSDVPPPVPWAAPAPRPAAPQRDVPHALPPLPGPLAEKRRGAVPTWMFLALGVLIVAALIGGGLWWLATGDEPDPAGQPPPSTTEPAKTTEAAEPADPADELPELPGVLNRNSGTFSPQEGVKRKLYGEDEALLLKQQGVRKVTWKGSSRTAGDTAMAYVILVAENRSPAKAESTARVLRGLSRSRVPQVKGGLDDFERLPTFRKVSEETNVYRVIYNSGSKTVRVGVAQTPGTDQQRLTTELADLLRQVTELLPPDKG